MLRIYEYWKNEIWDTSFARAVIAESRKEADEAYRADLDDEDQRTFDSGEIKCKTRKIKTGMVIQPMGYDYCALSFSQHNSKD